MGRQFIVKGKPAAALVVNSASCRWELEFVAEKIGGSVSENRYILRKKLNGNIFNKLEIVAKRSQICNNLRLSAKLRAENLVSFRNKFFIDEVF